MAEISKRESFKFIRLKSRPFYLANTASDNRITGYRNTYREFSNWDDERNDPAGNGLSPVRRALYTFADGSLSPAPYDFFCPETPSSYTDLVFVIDGDFAPYSRAIHNLRTLSPKIYIQTTTGDFRSWVNPAIIRTWGGVEPESENTLVFRVNPEGVSIQKKKLFKKLRTKGGWAFQHWGPEIGQITIQGTTGSLLPDLNTVFTVPSTDPSQNLENEVPSVFNSPAYAALRELESWYDADQNENAINNGYLTAVQYRDRVYVGHIQDFQLEEKASEPFLLFYKVTFLVHYDASDPQAAMSRLNNQIVRNEETQELIRGLKT